MKTTDPEGQVWRVSRRWVPWRRRGAHPADMPFGDLDFGGPTEFIIGLVLALALPFILALVFVSVEFLLLFALMPIAVAVRMIWGKAWSVEVRKGFTPWHEEVAGTWAQSSALINSLRDNIASGSIPPNTLARKANSELAHSESEAASPGSIEA